MDVLDKFIELFLFNSWLLHYQCLGQVHRIVSSSTADPYDINVLDKFILLFSLNSFLHWSSNVLDKIEDWFPHNRCVSEG